MGIVAIYLTSLFVTTTMTFPSLFVSMLYHLTDCSRIVFIARVSSISLQVLLYPAIFACIPRYIGPFSR